MNPTLDLRERHLRLIAQDMTQVTGSDTALAFRVACCWLGTDVMIVDMDRASAPLTPPVAVVTDGVEHDLVDVSGTQLSGVTGINVINHTDKGALTNQGDSRFAAILSGTTL